MADFDPPFGHASDKRLPTTIERDQGFVCGPADRRLFDGLFHRIESEIGEVITFAGITQTDDRFTQLREAIEALISAATGGGATPDYLLISQARVRLPIHFDIQTADGKIPVTTPVAGTIRVPGGTTFQHRGIFPITTALTDFPTDASKTYHLRWDPTNGFRLLDLASGVYNPGALTDINPSFDSTYDNMLVSRVVTNASNIATITNLVNWPVLTTSGVEVDARGAFKGGVESAGYQNNVAPSAITNFDTVNVNWARTPQTYLTALNDVRNSGTSEAEFSAGVRPLSRYQLAVWGQGDRDIFTGWAARA